VTVVRAAAVVLGAVSVLLTVGSAVRTVVLPRAVVARLGRAVFLAVRLAFRARIGRSASFERRDRILALYGPTGLLALLAAWLLIVIAGGTAMFWGLGQGERSLRTAFDMAGSSALTLGFARPSDLPSTVVAFTVAATGLLLLAMLITYLPSIYSAFSRREALVASLETLAGSPPTPWDFLVRLYTIRGLNELTEVWQQWERWFVELQETHVSVPVLAFFRSPLPEQSWVTAAGVVLDTAAVAASTLDRPNDPAAQLMLRAGWLALRRVAAYFRLPHAVDPSPTDPISVTREEYDQFYDRLRDAGIALTLDRDRAWRDFAGWRVNYDRALVELARLVDAPPAPWSSDRAYTPSPWWRP
jgi:hypothetical protein